MNKIVRKHYPASRLPEDVRAEFPPNSHVTIMQEDGEAPTRKSMTAERLRELFAMSDRRFNSAQEVDDYVRAMRDEWD